VHVPFQTQQIGFQDGSKREQLGRRNHRLWHGTADPKAWERGLAPNEWHPLSRRYAVAQGQGLRAPALSAASAPAAAAAPVAKRARSRSVPAMVQPVRTSSAPLPPPAAVSFMGPGVIPTRPAANPSRAPNAAPRSILVGPVMYRSQAPVMASFPPNLGQPALQIPARTAPAASSQSHSRAKKRSPKKRRRSRAPSSSEEEESSLASEDVASDEANSDTQDSDFGALGSAAHHKRQKVGKAASGGAAVNPEAVSKQDEEDFLRALTQFWAGQGSIGRKILAKYQPFESIRLASGMHPFSAHQFWVAVMALGGHSVVRSCLLPQALFHSFVRSLHMFFLPRVRYVQS